MEAELNAHRASWKQNLIPSPAADDGRDGGFYASLMSPDLSYQSETSILVMWSLSANQKPVS